MGRVHGTQRVSVRTSRILVVEDDHEISDLLLSIFRSEGYHSVAAYDATDAISLALSDAPDLITLDLAMPERDGRELIRELKGNVHTSHIPIVVVSAFTDQLDAHDRTVLAAVLQKPFDLNHLLGIVAKLTRANNPQSAGR